MLQAMLSEMEHRSNELSEAVGSIYFGGGTPSLLSPSEVQLYLKKAKTLWTVDSDVEITLEANPDDLSEDYLNALSEAGVNRLSIGIQSFRNDDLNFMKRIHSADEAKKSIELAKLAGFKNISIDLIFGTPGMSMEQWKNNLIQFANFDVDHLSAYGLTVEPNTLLHHEIKNNKRAPLKEDQVAEQFVETMAWAEKNNYDHYEISNYARNGSYSKHNSNYWNRKKYLGIGPSAHSFKGNIRRWNIANNAIYLNEIKNNSNKYFDQERLSDSDIINEKIMTGLRQSKGISTTNFPHLSLLEKTINNLIASNHLRQNESQLRLTRTGKLFADKICSDLFIDN